MVSLSHRDWIKKWFIDLIVVFHSVECPSLATYCAQRAIWSRTLLWAARYVVRIEWWLLGCEAPCYQYRAFRRSFVIITNAWSMSLRRKMLLHSKTAHMTRQRNAMVCNLKMLKHSTGNLYFILLAVKTVSDGIIALWFVIWWSDAGL